jgi:carbon storage regulator
MLILSRKVGESIRIGDDIEVVVSSVDKNKVKLGISSPRHIPVYREELYRKIQEENRAAADMRQDDLQCILESFLNGRITSSVDEEKS